MFFVNWFTLRVEELKIVRLRIRFTAVFTIVFRQTQL